MQWLSAIRKLIAPPSRRRWAQIQNTSRGVVLASRADVADTGSARRRGLLDHKQLASGEGIWIVPCSAVHTFGMKFGIDVVFLDRAKRIRKVRHSMGAMRMSWCIGAHSVVELPAGSLKAANTEPGDYVEITLTSLPLG